MEALPESKAKTRARVLRTQKACIDRILEQLPVVAFQAPEQEIVETAPSTPPHLGHVQEQDPEDLGDCLPRCARSLSDALASVNQAESAGEAVERLLASYPPEQSIGAAVRFSIEDLHRCANLVPLAAAALGKSGSTSLVWRRFLAFLLLSPARLGQEGTGLEAQQLEAAARLGGLVALLARPAALRGALQLAFAALHHIPSGRFLNNFAPGMLAVVQVAFGGTAFDECPPQQSDLEVALQALRFLRLCQVGQLASPHVLAEANETLGKALECRARVEAASKTTSRVEAAADVLQLAARARGDLFFEDTVGAGDSADGAPSPGVSSIVAGAAIAAAGERAFEKLDGVEDLRAAVKAAEAIEAAAGALPDGPEQQERSGRKRWPVGVLGPTRSSEAPTALRRVRQRRKSRPAP